MKIMIICAANLPIPCYKGGATETLVTELLKRIGPDDGLHIDVFSNCRKEEGYSEGNAYIKYHYIQKTWFDKLYTLFFRILRLALLKRINIPSAFAANLCRNVDFGQYDMVLLEGDKGQVNVIRRHFSKTIVLHIHTVMTFTKSTPFAKRILSNCDYVLGNSYYTKKVISEIDADQADKVIAFQNCINTDIFKLPQSDETRRAIRAKYSIKDNEYVYIYCGRLDPGKGVRELIKAFKKCNQNTKLIIVGSGWYGNNDQTPYARELIELSKDISDRIIFTGYVEHAEIPNYYYAADVCVVPSIYEEAACLVVLEAQACGVPVIATNIGGIPEFAFPKSSVLVDLTDSFVDDLATQMRSDLTEKREAIYGNEFNSFIESKSISSYYKEFINIINRIEKEKDE